MRRLAPASAAASAAAASAAAAAASAAAAALLEELEARVRVARVGGRERTRLLWQHGEVAGITSPWGTNKPHRPKSCV